MGICLILFKLCQEYTFIVKLSLKYNYILVNKANMFLFLYIFFAIQLLNYKLILTF